MARHLNEVGAIAVEGMRRFVPASDNRIAHDELAGLFRGTTGRLAFVQGILATLLPTHDANADAEPGWITRWLEDAAAGHADMTLYYPKTA